MFNYIEWYTFCRQFNSYQRSVKSDSKMKLVMLHSCFRFIFDSQVVIICMGHNQNVYLIFKLSYIYHYYIKELNCIGLLSGRRVATSYVQESKYYTSWSDCSLCTAFKVMLKSYVVWELRWYNSPMYRPSSYTCPNIFRTLNPSSSRCPFLSLNSILNFIS